MKVQFILLAAVAVVVASCAHKVERRISDPVAQPVPRAETEYLKAHMQDGGLYLLSSWQVDDGERRIQGSGTRYDFNREVTETGQLELSLDSVALFETNAVRVSSAMIPLTVLSVASVGMTVFCISNPKACFGSCPTFYQPGEANTILAEGFSASIAPSLEDTDLDALPSVRPDDGSVQLVMRNEALETHVVRWADLIAVPRRPGRRVYAATDGVLVHGTPATPPIGCRAAEGDCVSTVSHADKDERWSLSDSTDLATREKIELEFERPVTAPGESLGLLIVSRQSLLPTYILYQGLAFMGTRATEWLAALGRQSLETRSRALELTSLLGGIEIEVLDRQGSWVPAGRLLETGPLASDTRVIPISSTGSGPIRVRLVLTQGMWRIDRVGLVTYGAAADPVRLEPAAVLRDGAADDDALERLRSRDDQLSTLPGDEYTLVYRLPDPTADYEFFLESRGYYLEWMRTEWLAEENLLRAAQLFLNPASALKSMAPEFKQIEPEMERVFWSSRYEPQD